MDEHSPICSLTITGDKDVSMSHDKKSNDVTTPDGEVAYGLLSRSCFYGPNLISGAPLDIQRFVKVTWLWGNDIITSWGRVPNEILWIRFPCLVSSWLDIYRFSNWSFCRLWPVQNWSKFCYLGNSKLTLLFHFHCFRQVTVILQVLLSLGKTLGSKKQSKPWLFDKKFKNHT